MNTNYLLSLSQTELAEKMEALKVDINDADENTNKHWLVETLILVASIQTNVLNTDAHSQNV